MIDGPLARLVDLPYRAGAALHRGAFLSGLVRRSSLDRFTVSVGALHFGGAGKTPLALDLLAPGSALLTRGYKGAGRPAVALCEDAEAVPWRRPLVVGDEVAPAQAWSERLGDEPAMVAALCPGIPVGIGADREASAAAVRRRHDVQRFVLDDAFSHHRLHRDLDVLAVPLEGTAGRFAPGLLREGIRASSRADVVVAVADLSLENKEDRLDELKQAMKYDGPAALCHKRPARLWSYDPAEPVAAEALAGRYASVVCALGRPDSLAASVQIGLGCEVVHTGLAADHHRFEPDELEAAERRALGSGAGIVVTSLKDAVRLPATWRPRMDWFVVETCLHWDLGEDLVEDLVKEAAAP